MISLIYFIPAKVGIKILVDVLENAFICTYIWLHGWANSYRLVHYSYIVAFLTSLSWLLISLLFIAIPTSFLKFELFKPGTRRLQASAHLVFLKLILCRSSVYMYVCVCVFPCLRLLITSSMIWHDMKPIWLVKQVLQLLYGNCSRYH